MKSEHFTNSTPNSENDVAGYLMPARSFFFVITEEVGKNGFLVRKIYESSKSPYLKNMNLTPLQTISELSPEIHGMRPKQWGSTASIAEHVMGFNHSNFISTSSIFPTGSPRFDGRSIFIDLDKAKKSGARIIETSEILRNLDNYKISNPHLQKRIEKIAAYISAVDSEVLVQAERIPASAIFTDASLQNTQTYVKYARVVQVLGVVLTAYDLAEAGHESYKTSSVKPITAEIIRQAGGWGTAMAGFKLGGAMGAAVTIETGPGAIIGGLVGGIVFGSAGYFGADWVADHIYEN